MFKVLRDLVQRYFSDEEAVVLAVFLVLGFTLVLTLGNMLTPLLAIAGYEVTTAEDAASALKMREAGRDFDVIISDIEMPGMNGFEFAEAVKKGDRWQGTPIVALSSHTSPGDFNRGREVGFTDYVAKFDRDALLSTLSQTRAAG